MAYSPIITEAGKQALINAQNNGLQLELTHIGFDSGKFEPTGQETEAVDEVVRVPIAGSARVSPTTFQIMASGSAPTPEDEAWIGAINFYSNDNLFAVLSRPDGNYFYLSSENQSVINYSLGVSALPDEAVNIIVDPDASVSLGMISQLQQQVVELSNAVGELVAGGVAHEWQGTALRIMNNDGSWGNSVDLKGIGALEAWRTIPGNEDGTLEEFLDAYRGLSAFESWKLIPGNENKTFDQFLSSQLGGAVSAVDIDPQNVNGSVTAEDGKTYKLYPGSQLLFPDSLPENAAIGLIVAGDLESGVPANFSIADNFMGDDSGDFDFDMNVGATMVKTNAAYGWSLR